MVQESISQFDLFDFFSVLVPGGTFLIGLYPLLPSTERITDVMAIITFVILGYVFGRGIHSVAIRWENAGHRSRFREELESPRTVPYSTVTAFYGRCQDQYPELALPDDPSDALDTTVGTLYSLVRGRIHMDSRGRSRSFQAIYAFYRNIAFVSVTLGIAYLVFGLVGGVAELVVSFGLVDSPDVYPYTPIILDVGIPPGLLIPTSIVIALIVWLICKNAMTKYREHYVQYLISDYLLIDHD